MENGNYELPLVRERLGDLSNGEIAALLNREILDFPTGRPFYAWDRRIEKDCCLIARLYFDDQYYEDEPYRMIGVLEKEAEKRGIKKVPLDELETVSFPYGDLSVSIFPKSDGGRYAELRGYMVAACGSLLKGFPKFFSLRRTGEMTIHDRNARAAAYSYRCQRKRYHKANASVQRALLSSSFLFIVALAAYIITK